MKFHSQFVVALMSAVASVSAAEEEPSASPWEGKATLGYLATSGNTYLESVTALSARLVGNLALVASYKIKNNSKVLAGTEKTDTFTALSFEYAF